MLVTQLLSHRKVQTVPKAMLNIKQAWYFKLKVFFYKFNNEYKIYRIYIL